MFIAKGHLHCNELFSKGAQSHNSVHVLRQHTGYSAWRKKLILHRVILFPKTYTNSHISKMGQKEDLENCRPVSLTSMSGKVLTEQILLSARMGHVLDNKGIRLNQHGFRKDRSCLTELVTFYDKVTCFVDEGKAVGVVYLDFSKAFAIVSHSILEKMAVHGLDRHVLRCLKTGCLVRPGEWW